MGRPERSVDPAAGPVQRFAHELRELRKAAGGPSYRTMARSAGFSATTLSQAAAGERLPSSAVVHGYVGACGADPTEWELRRKAAEAEATEAPADGEQDGPPPYRGLARFEPDDHELFFGRDRLVAQLREMVCDHRFAVMFGASGSGKSSLLRAGLIPCLRKAIGDRGHPAVLRVLTPGARPATTYGHLLAPAPGEPESWVVVDQFEEVFTLCRDRVERARFVDLLLTARDPDNRLRVVVAVRADFYARCAEHRGLADALRGAGLLVGPMAADELREAVVKPAAAVGLLVERELTASIIEEVLDQPGGLPMLSHALLETWRRRRGRMLTVAAYEAAGGVRGAIAASAEEAYGQLSPAQAHTARQLLLRLIEPGQGTADTRRPLTRTELEEWADPSVPSALERLAGARLLTVDEEGVQLAHEALITCWPRLHGWIEEDRERLRHHRRLAEAARGWLEADQDPGTLYRGIRLARAEELFGGGGQVGVLTAPERAFLTAALTAREAERRAATRTTRRARLLVTALSTVLVVALIAGLAAWQQRRDNERQRTDDTARRLAAVADAMRTTDPRTAMQLGVAAWRIATLPETRRALLGSLTQPEQDTFTDPAPGDRPLRFLADSGRTLLSVDGRTWQTWNVAAHRRTASGRLPDGQVLAAGPDARVLALAGDDGVRLWDTAAGRWTGAPSPLPLSSDLGFGAGSGSYLVGSIDDDRVQLRSVADGGVLFETRAAGRSHVASSADDRLVAVCPSGRPPQVRDLSRPHTLPGAWEHARGICDDDHSRLVFGGSGGSRLAAVSDTRVHVWDTRSGRRVADIDDPGVKYAAFSEDGAFLATARGDEIRVWRLAAPSDPVFRHPLNNQHLYGGLAWDPGHPVLRYLEGGTVHSLDLGAAVTSTWRGHALDSVLLSPDGRTLATAERFGRRYLFQLRDTSDGHLLRTLPSPPLPVSHDRTQAVVPQHTLALMAFSPDGTALAYGVSAPGREAAPQRFTVWDVARDRPRTALDLAAPGSAAAVVSLAVGTGGSTLYVARTPAIGELSDEVWDTAHHRRTAVLTKLASSHLAVRPDGRLLVGDNRTARLPAGPVTGHDLVQGDQIGALAFAPDGSRLAAGDQTGRVALWDSALRRRAGILANVFPAPLGDTPEAVSALALSTDGRTLAVGGDAGTLQLWDIATQQPLGGPLTTPGEDIKTLAFSRDSGTLYAGSAHVPLQRYSIAPSRAVTRVCARAGAGLTRAQWRTYVPGAPYRRVCENAGTRALTSG
ncbi:nSTAND1 domain-containing NTPase [Streptomyces sp. SYSU K217416]